jgi:hypothetical protein
VGGKEVQGRRDFVQTVRTTLVISILTTSHVVEPAYVPISDKLSESFDRMEVALPDVVTTTAHRVAFIKRNGFRPAVSELRT